MAKLLKRLLAAALAVSTLLTSGACTAATDQKTKYITEITITDIQYPKVSYSEDSKTYAVNQLKTCLSSVLTTFLGEKASTFSHNFSDLFLQIVESCEAREISERNMILMVETICGNVDLLSAIVSEEEGQGYKALQLFSEICKITGTDTACLLFYDLALIYCNYFITQYYNLYEQYAFPYQLRYAQEWEGYYAQIQSIGEQNFLYLLKIIVSTLSARTDEADSVQSLLSGFAAGEGALYFRAQGYMMQKLTLTAENWNFIFTAIGASGYSKKFSAIYSAGDCGALSEHFPQFISDLAYALTLTDADCVQSLKDGDYSAFLYKIFHNWENEMWQNFAALVSGIGGDYSQYIDDNGLLLSYLIFASNVTPVDLIYVRICSQDEFIEYLKNYIASYSAQFAYVLFEL